MTHYHSLIRGFTIIVAAFAFMMNAASSEMCVSPVAGLISWWSGDGTADDVAGKNDGELVNGTGFGAGKVGTALILDGADDFVRVANAASLEPANLTIEGWLKFDAFGTRVLVSKTVGGFMDDSYIVWFQDGTLSALVGDGGGIRPYLSYSWTPLLGTWHHIAFTFDDSANLQTLYIDGASVASGFTPITIGYDSHPLIIGAEVEVEAVSFFFAGGIDELSLYNRALSAQDIAALYAAGTSGKCRIDPIPLIVALLETIDAINLANGIESSLDAKLEKALRVLQDALDNNNHTAASSIEAFISEVEAQRGNHITEEDSASLVNQANAILDAF